MGFLSVRPRESRDPEQAALDSRLRGNERIKSIARSAIVISALFFAFTPAQADDAGLKALAAGGHVVMVRHGLTTPGAGDPLGFKLDDCKTQRNLIEDGRAESRKLGELLRGRKIVIDQVLSSEWCRCIETAKLIGVGGVETYSPLNNLFGRPQNRDAQEKELRQRIAAWKGPGNLLLVTHGANMGALMQINPETAAGAVLTPAPGTDAGFKVVGRISPEG
jgi:phosphohistidine phosphatase SixA